MTEPFPQVYIIDDDDAVRDALSLLLETADLPHRSFGSAVEFLDHCDGTERGCLVLDIRMPGMSGLELQERLNERSLTLPIIFMTGHGDVPMAVEAMRKGALDFLRKPIREQDLLDRIQEALEQEAGLRSAQFDHEQLLVRRDSLTPREFEVFGRVAQGHANKVIGFDLGISERTVEVHRAHVMQKLDAETLADLVRFQVALKKSD